MRVLFTTVPMHGHFYPMVPLAQAFRSAGHDVLVATPRSLVDAVTTAGLPAAVTGPSLSLADIMMVDRDGRPVPAPRGPEETMSSGGRAWGRLAARTLPATEAIVDGWHPDLVISEPSELAGPIVASLRGLPWVRHTWGVTSLPRSLPFTEQELSGELAALGLTGLPEPDAVVKVVPATIAGDEDPDGLPARYVPYNGPGTMPDWALAERTRPRVLLTFGSLVPHMRVRDFVAILGELASGLSSLGAEVVVGVEDAFAAGLAGGLPAGVVAVGWQPLSLALPACDLLVHHGGSGSMMTAFAHGVPQLALPQSADQFVNAFTLVGVGAGRMLMPDRLGVDAVLAEARELLDDPGYAHKAAHLSEQIAAMPTPAELVTPLTELTTG
jgi:UDP:flavonoid glycosyltransferase YjiC (YdhE family)